MQDLRQSTAGQVVVFGPFIDDTDFKTAETALTIANTDIKLRTHAATTFANKDSGGLTHIEGGYYQGSFNATDTATLGRLDVKIKMAGALDVVARFMVLSAGEFDAKYAATGPVPNQGVVARGTAQSATATTLVLAAAETHADDTLIGATLLAFGATQGYWQSRQITDYVLSTDTATVDTWTVTPSGTITYVVLGSAPSSASAPPAVNVTQISGDATAADTLELFAEALDQSTGQLDSGSLAAGTLTAAAIAADAITAAKVAADVTTEIQAGLATAAALTTVEGKIDTVDTVVDAVKAKTDSLTFTTAGIVDANAERINNVAITGDGSATPFGV